MSSVNGVEALFARGGASNSSETRLLNSLSDFQGSWDIKLGNDVVCNARAIGKPQDIQPALYLHFQCGLESLTIGVESLDFLWLHPMFRQVPYGFEVPDIFILPVLKELLAPLEKELRRILRAPVEFLGHFYEFEGASGPATICFALYNDRLAEHRRNAGLERDSLGLAVYMSSGEGMFALLDYLSKLPKPKNLQSIAADSSDFTEVYVRVGYCFITPKQFENIRVGDVLIASDYLWTRRKAKLVFLDQEVPCALEKDAVRVSEFYGTGVSPEKHIESCGSDVTAGLPISQIKNALFVSVSFDIAQETVMLREISQIKPGYTLKVDPRGGQVTLRVHRRAIAVGEPMEFNSMLGVKIVKLL